MPGCGAPGHIAADESHVWFSAAGKLTGSLAPGFASPKSNDARAVPDAWPGRNCTMMAFTLSFQGISTAPGQRTTTIVFGHAAATCCTSLSWRAPRLSVSRS